MCGLLKKTSSGIFRFFFFRSLHIAIGLKGEKVEREKEEPAQHRKKKKKKKNVWRKKSRIMISSSFSLSFAASVSLQSSNEYQIIVVNTRDIPFLRKNKVKPSILQTVALTPPDHEQERSCAVCLLSPPNNNKQQF